MIPPPVETLTFRVIAEIDVAEARQAARQLAGRHGFRTVQAYGFATAVSEIATNLVLHATRGGIIRLTARTLNEVPTLGLIAEDDGPGIPDLALAMQDGYSTRGGLGCGLPGTRRLVDTFAVTSRSGAGTRIVCGLTRL
ncbi:MAG: ATP-binding protein [Methylobacterium sp.]|uniref:ATP-binding protein n=1 Tax=Methylobacterium sp. TaxID=409 RepID=UPI002716A4A4|nr:ATP-binding protein [Methylobacterium sp.]MDO9428505.1 ATP-binding protein [Methylobacterium sp.]